MRLLVGMGVVGINLEDSPGRDGRTLLEPDVHAERIRAAREAALAAGGDLVINARTDVFFEHGDHAVGEALDRAKAYAAAGASGFFVPGLVNDALIGRVAEAVTLPVNVMVMDGVPSNGRLSELGVARISYGPIPYVRAMGRLRQEATAPLNEALPVREG